MTVAERPDVGYLLWDFPGAWPAFMYQDLTSDLYYAEAATAFAEFVMLALDEGRPVARSFSAPLAWDGEPTHRLPDDGWESGCTTPPGHDPASILAVESSIRHPERRFLPFGPTYPG